MTHGDSEHNEASDPDAPNGFGDTRPQSGRIFVSHSHHDNAWCAKLAHDLRASGFQVWIDLESMQHAATIPENVSLAIADSQTFAVVISSHSVGSEWVFLETDTAIDRRATGHMDLLVVALEDIDPWPKRLELLRAMPRVRFFDQPYEVAIAQLVNGLRQGRHRAVSRERPEQQTGQTGRAGRTGSLSMQSANAVERIKAHEGPILCVSVSHDGRYIASGGGDGVIRIWERSSHQRVSELRLTTQAADWIRTLAWSPDDAYLLAGQDNGIFCFWNVRTESKDHVLRYPSGSRLLDLTWTDQGAGCITSAGWVGMFSATRAEASVTWEYEVQMPSAPILAASWSRNMTLAAALRDGQILVGNPMHAQRAIPQITLTERQRKYQNPEIRALRWSTDGAQLAAMFADGRVVIWDSTLHLVLRDWETEQNAPRSLCWVGPNSVLGVADGSGMVKLWNLKSSKVVEEVNMPQMRILDVVSDQENSEMTFALASGDLGFWLAKATK